MRFECVAACIERAALRWFTSGPVTDAVLASCAVPGLLHAVQINGEHFFDGGLVRSVPIGRAADLGARRIFVLHVGRLEQPLRPPNRPWEVARWPSGSRRRRFEEELANVPSGVGVHLLPTGSTSPALTVRYRSVSGVRQRIEAAHEASARFLDDLLDNLGSDLGDDLGAGCGCGRPVPMLPSRPVRRCVMPLEALVLVALAVVCLVVALIGAVLAPFTSRRRVLRIAAWALSYCLVELASLVAAGCLWLRRLVPGRLGLRADAERRAANEALLTWALGRVLAAGRRWLGFEVVVADSSDATALGRDEPVLVLARHGGPGDSFALAHLLLTRYHRRVRIVLKDVLQFDPLIDLLLNRLGSCFLGPSRGAGDDPTRRLDALAGDLGPGDALLLFPEGANWTPLRRRRAIGRLRRERKPEQRGWRR